MGNKYINFSKLRIYFFLNAKFLKDTTIKLMMVLTKKNKRIITISLVVGILLANGLIVLIAYVGTLGKIRSNVQQCSTMINVLN